MRAEVVLTPEQSQAVAMQVLARLVEPDAIEQALALPQAEWPDLTKSVLRVLVHLATGGAVFFKEVE